MNTAGLKQNLDQQRANHAWDCVNALKKKSAGDQSEYAGEAKKLPVRIMASGLGQALAFLLAKANKGSKQSLTTLHSDMTKWVVSQVQGAADTESLLNSIVQGDTDFLRWSTNEAQAWLAWLNRFLDAQIDSED